jgi:YD repeat-containing protein
MAIPTCHLTPHRLLCRTGLISLMVLASSFPGVVQAQTANNSVNVGFPETGVFEGSDFDSVQMNNGNLHIQIPFSSIPGRGLSWDVIDTYDNKGWTVIIQTLSNGFESGRVFPEGRASMQWNLSTPTSYWVTFKRGGAPCPQDPQWQGTSYSGHVLRLPDGTKHPFWPNTIQNIGCGYVAPAKLYASDGSGWILTLDPATANVLSAINKHGTVVPLAYGQGTLVRDSNGNFMDTHDTLGRTMAGGVTYTDSNGQVNTIQVTPVQVVVQTQLCQFVSWNGRHSCGEYGATWSLPSVIQLPNNQSYTFTYAQNLYGEPTSVTLPTGGTITWTWGSPDKGGRKVTSRTVSANGQTSAWTYTWGTPILQGSWKNVMTDPLGNDTVYTCSDIHGLAGYLSDEPNCLITTTQYFAGSSANGTLLKTVQADHDGALQPIRKTVTWNQTNQVSKTETDWDQFAVPGWPPGTISWGNPVEQREYDYGVGAPGSLVRRTHFNYLHLTNSNYSNLNIADRLTSKIVYDGAGNVVAQTQTIYDGSSLVQTSTCNGTGGAPQHDYCNFGSSNLIRGNPTQVQRWLNASNTWLSTTNSFDDLGNLRTTTDPGGHTTTYAYDDRWANSFCPPSANSQAYVTQVTNHLGQRLQTTYFPCTAFKQATKDENDLFAGRAGTTYTFDLMNRLLTKTLPEGGQTSFSYADSAPVSVTSTTKITSALNLVSTIFKDGLGRTSQSQFTSDPDGTTKTDTTYDVLGRTSTVSNPYRTATDPGPTNGLTTTIYDALGRMCVVVPPDGTAVPGNTCPTSAPSNDVFTAYSGNTTTVTDQAGKKRKSVTDGLGRLAQIFEDPAGLNYETDYQYDTLDNLTCAVQKGTDTTPFTTCAAAPATWRPRSFVYNSLSQLTSASNPESGTLSYSYDADGNVLTKTDARNITITYAYDVLNRLTQKSYSDGTTATVKYGYDAVAPTGCTLPALTIGNGIGKRTGMCDAAGAEAWSYDITANVGWKITDARTTNSVTKSTIVQNNLAGSPATLAYPSGRTITYTPGGAGRPLSAADTPYSINYATAAHYAPQGALTSLINGANLSSTYLYNSRLQPCWMYATTGTALPWNSPSVNCTSPDPGPGNVLDLQYNFSLGVADNGNVMGITNKRDTTRSQSFTYDVLNRLATAYTSGNLWGETFQIDPWGNLNKILVYSGKPQPENLNQMAGNNNRFTGMSYDAAGNLLNDGASTYFYDARTVSRAARA